MDDYAPRRIQVAQAIDVAIDSANAARGQAASADWRRICACLQIRAQSISDLATMPFVTLLQIHRG